MNDIEQARAELTGIFNITVTPFTAEGAFDPEAFAENVERVIGLGYDGVLIGGTYGEFATMTPEERAELFRKAIDVVDGRVPVMLCSAGSDVRVVRELTELAGQLGGAPMVTPPFVSEVTPDQIVEFFREVAPLSRTGIVIYNAPGIGITLSPETIERLAEIPGVVALKQGDLNPTTVDVLAGRLGGRLRLFCASDLTWMGPLAAGFDGVSSTNSGALPELILAAFRAMQAGDAARAGELHRSWYPLRELARSHGQPQTTKAAMALRGFRGGSVRPPLRPLDEEARSELRAALAQLAAQPEAGIADLQALAAAR